METPTPAIILPVYGDVCIRNQRRKRQKKLLVLLFLDFAKNTTLHGLRYLTETGLHIIEKLYWFLTFFGSAGICFFFIYNVWYKWQTSPVIVSFNAKLVSADEVPFPSVTICPNVKFYQSAFNYTKIRRFYYKDRRYRTNESNTRDIKTADILNLLCDVKLYPMIKEKYYLNSSDIHTLQKITERDFFSSCLMDGRQCGKNMFQQVLTKSGLCYNFNGLSANEILSDYVQKDYNYTSRTESTRNWTLGDGYTSNSRDNVYPYRGKNSMVQPFLDLSLNAPAKIRDSWCNVYSGLKIYLHHPADFPQSTLYHFAAEPDKRASMAIKFAMETADPDLKKYPIEMRQCYFPEDKLTSLKYFRQYTYNNCMLECLTNYVYDRCGCVGFYMPFYNSTQICSALTEKQCVEPAESTFNTEQLENCRCLPTCNLVKYDAEFHSTAYSVWDEINARLGLSRFATPPDPDMFKESAVAMFYKQPMFQVVHRSVLYSLTDFMSSCGGLLGLFLGFSWLTLAEIFYFLTIRVFKTIRADLKNEKSASNAKK